MAKTLVIRNRKGDFVNTNYFSKSAEHFLKTGVYTTEAENSVFWLDFWNTERRRSLEGYEFAGVRITGEHYFYLNYTQFLRVDKREVTGKRGKKRKETKKVVGFPDFWDGDYNYFWARELARKDILNIFNVPIPSNEEKANKLREKYFKRLKLYLDVDPADLTGSWNLLAGKARRKGFAQPADAKIWTPDGYKTMGEIQHGDKVITLQGEIATVEEKSEVGYEEVFTIADSCGRTVKAHKDHLFAFYVDDDPRFTLLSIKEAIKILNKGQKLRLMSKTKKRFLPDFDLRIPVGTMFSALTDRKKFEEVMHLFELEGFFETGVFRFPYKYKAGNVNYWWEFFRKVISNKKNGKIRFIRGIYLKDLHEILARYHFHFHVLAKDAPKPDYVDIYETDSEDCCVTAIVPTSYEPVWCISLTGKDTLYHTDYFVVSANSLKAGSIASRNFSLIPYSKTYLMAYESKYLYPRGLFQKAYENLSFLQDNTPWGQPSDAMHQPGKGAIRASYYVYKDGKRYEKGFISEINSITFNNNPSASRGIDASDVFFEEAGAFGTPGTLKKAYKTTASTIQAGAFTTGLITVFGTSGALESGSLDFSEMMFKPRAFNFLPFKNIWDDGYYKGKEVGFFFPGNWNLEGFYDEWGNSRVEEAKDFILREREQMRRGGASEADIIEIQQEYPLTPIEAFTVAKEGIFHVVDLQGQLIKVESEDLFHKKGIPVELIEEDSGEITAKPVFDKKVKPITDYFNVKPTERGVLVVYEPPIAHAPKGSYYIGYDPVRELKEGTSLASFFVYKSGLVSPYDKDKIVAEFIGRRQEDEVEELLLRTAKWYKHSQIMHENMVVGVRSFFKRRGALQYLALQPDGVISKHINNSKVNRIYGTHMTLELKLAGERYIKEWLQEIVDYDEEGNPIRAYEKIYSPRLLKELIFYNRAGNFDMISALMMVMFQRQEMLINEGMRKKRDNTDFSKKFKSVFFKT